MPVAPNLYPIPCPHAGMKYEPGEDLPRLSHYRPLSPEEVSVLLVEANLGQVAPARANAIQVRLRQAIPGCECPRAIEGPVADAELAVSHFYRKMIRGQISRAEAEQLIVGVLFSDDGAAIAERIREAVALD